MSADILVIGANGGIGAELVKQLCEANPTCTVHCVSRAKLPSNFTNQLNYQIDSSNEIEVRNFVHALKQENIFLSLVICTTGILHTSGEKQLKPEKRLEDINPVQLAEYFKVNTIVPTLWLKHLVSSVDKSSCNIVFFSARVGSISENVLGGWYGYRASKAALNMIVKTASIEYQRRRANSCLACYHPGTVDTGLSKPFQSNVKPGKLFTAEFTVKQLLSHIQSFTPEQSPYYIDWEGKSINY